MKKIITLHDLEKLWAEYQGKKTGKIIVPDFPQELTPAWRSYCHKRFGAWQELHRKRKIQLGALGILETHDIDFYLDNEEIIL